jgi:predicted transposase/invertase (TIGR01784 family)
MVTIAQQLEQKGIEQGRQEGKLEIAEKLLKSGMAPSVVKEMTGLSEEELAKIRHR